MSGTSKLKFLPPDGNALTAGLTSNDARTRCAARCGASAWYMQAAEWMQDEISRQDADEVQIMHAFFRSALMLQANFYTSIAEDDVKVDNEVRHLLHKWVDDYFSPFAEISRKKSLKRAAQ